jgi:hypothetical protein
VIARRGNGHWYVAGINADAAEKTLALSLAQLSVSGRGTLIRDGDGGNLSFSKEAVELSADKKLVVKLKGRGGFVIVFD